MPWGNKATHLLASLPPVLHTVIIGGIKYPPQSMDFLGATLADHDNPEEAGVPQAGDVPETPDYRACSCTWTCTCTSLWGQEEEGGGEAWT